MSNSQNQFNIEEFLKKLSESYESILINTFDSFKKDIKKENVLEDKIIDKMMKKWEKKTIRSLQIGLDRFDDFYSVI